MALIKITEGQLSKLLETAMDLDIYVQPIEHPSSNGNEGVESSISDSIDKLKELLVLFKTGKKIYPENQIPIHKLLDAINKVYLDVKLKN